MNRPTMVYIRFGLRGRRVAHLQEAHPRGGWIGHTWNDAGHRWTWSRRILSSAILGPVELRDPHVRRAIAAASPGRPLCRHQEHGILTVLRAVAL